MPPMQKLRVSTVPGLLFVLVMVVESGCRPGVDPVDPEPGIPLELATDRARSIQDLRYELAFTIPAQVSEPISGRVVVRFRTEETATPLVLDFAPGADFVKSVSHSGRPVRLQSDPGPHHRSRAGTDGGRECDRSGVHRG